MDALLLCRGLVVFRVCFPVFVSPATYFFLAFGVALQGFGLGVCQVVEGLGCAPLDAGFRVEHSR